MKGFVPTPPNVVDFMVEMLFAGRTVDRHSRLLDPGCGTGEFIAGVLRWCERTGSPRPRILGVELDPDRALLARRRFIDVAEVEIVCRDFLADQGGQFDFVVGNPPYVPITALSVDERQAYRRRFVTAQGRFDLYLLFFEQSLRLMGEGARLVFITPEKYLYVETAEPLRQLLSRMAVEDLTFVSEATFGDLVTYPLISSVTKESNPRLTHISHRNGDRTEVRLPASSSSWASVIRGGDDGHSGAVLGDVCERVSCGIATGADSVYVMRNKDLPSELMPFAHPTVSGRQLKPGEAIPRTHSMLVPYSADGGLLPESRLAKLGDYLAEEKNRALLEARTCAVYKPWYAFHETPPLRALLRPKILCKDIGASPHFFLDESGDIVPRHSVYYVIPEDPAVTVSLLEYLNSDVARRWLVQHCQRAANGFVRLQSRVLKRLPLPEELVGAATLLSAAS